MKEEITGVILAGGKNSRMGTDKGLLQVDGKIIVERIVEALKPVVDDLLIITNGKNYDYLGYKTYNDLVKDCGPMGGIFTALLHSNTEKNFVVSCDMPFLSTELIQFIADNATGCEIAVPRHGEMLEPLCAVYTKKCCNKFETLLKNKNRKLHDALKQFNVKEVQIPENIFSTDCFANINTPNEYEKIKT